MMPQAILGHLAHVMETRVVIDLFPFVAVIRGELFAVITGVLMNQLSYASSLDIGQQSKTDLKPLSNQDMGEFGWEMSTVLGRKRS